MKNKYIEKLKRLVVGSLREERVKIVLFGSRAGSGFQLTSDVDVGIVPYGKFDEKKLSLLKDKIEDLNIPYKVEIVDFSKTSADFKKEAMKEVIVWKE